MIAETAVTTQDASIRHTQSKRAEPLSLNRIAAALQVVLATRRAARSEAHAYSYSVARGR